MHIAHDMRLLNAKFRLWEHNIMSLSDKMVHSRMFWAAVVLMAGVAILLALTILMGSSEIEFSTPLIYPFSPYAL
ncbi:MAG: hypothetical protein CVV39_01795 [Planctomycetes bacterium HGW-Planctomycetes-1]|nr:MAG: hypothetical protein CVV39_01795 [Planctomycetes bacterium HGW-Planctomycetes-1]